MSRDFSYAPFNDAVGAGQKCGSPVRIRWLLEDHPAAANERAREGHHRGNQPEHRPHGFGKDVEPPKMQVRKPFQPAIGEFVRGIEKEQTIEQPWERKVGRTDAPEQNEREEPESESAMQLPVHSGEADATGYGEAAAPVFHARPPDDSASDAQQSDPDRRYPVYKTSHSPDHQILVKVGQPSHKGPTGEFVAMNQDDARNAHQPNVQPHRSADAVMRPEQCIP